MTKTYLGSMMLYLLFLSCDRKPDLEKEKAEILRLESLQREYHFKKNAAEFVNMFSQDFITVNRGIISKPGREESIARFSKYFNSVEFVKWDDVTPPLVRISEDATVAWTVLDKLVVVKMKNAAGAEVLDTTHFAWMTTYRKEDSMWKIDGSCSTNM